MSRTDRGQLTSAPISLVVLLVAVIAGYVGIEVMSTIPADQSLQNAEHVCNGVWGCSGPTDVWSVVAPFLVIVIGIFCISVVGRAGRSSPPPASGNDGVTYVKEQYVEGDVETVVELEELLEDEIDDPWGDEGV